MKTNQIKILKITMLLIAIPLLAAVVIAFPSCSASRKATKTQTEAPPPPPPPPVEKEIYTVVEEMPAYPGGDKALMEFIIANVQYPQSAKDKGIQGRVIIRFCVTDVGNVENIQVIRGVDKSLDDEAVRVVKLLKSWTPGKQGGKPVNVWYSVPITFSLTGSQDPYSRQGFNIYGADTVYFNLKDMPQFPGGADELKRFKEENLKIPVEVLSLGFEGNVWVNFIVAKDGKLSDFTISGGVSPAIDAEALRVAKLMPSWKPGTENGKSVIVKTGTIFNFYPPSSDPSIPSEVYVVVEEMPKYPGGDSALIKFIYNNIVYPKEAKDKGIQGRVIVRFCVNYKGGVDRVGVIRGVDPLLDAEAIRVIKILSAWQPGKQSGNPVNVWYSVPVTFALKGPDKLTAPEETMVPPPPPSPPPPPPMPPLISGYDEPPVFQGGEAALAKFILSSIKYPQSAKERKISGTVLVRCTINETGMAEKITVLLSIDPDLDAEALRVVNTMPLWTPGKLKEKPVSVTYNVPVKFKLQ